MVVFLQIAAGFKVWIWVVVFNQTEHSCFELTHWTQHIEKHHTHSTSTSRVPTQAVRTPRRVCLLFNIWPPSHQCPVQLVTIGVLKSITGQGNVFTTAALVFLFFSPPRPFFPRHSLLQQKHQKSRDDPRQHDGCLLGQDTDLDRWSWKIKQKQCLVYSICATVKTSMLIQ